ncbi:MAG: flagellar protein FlaG [Nitrospira sp.]|nr:flagellar protein FlaG [Nitrospira sp.]
MIHSVAPKADPRVDRVHEAELSGSAGQKLRAKKGDLDGQSTFQDDRARIDRAATKVNEVLSLADLGLKIEVDDETKRVVVKVIEQKSGEVIRQIPAKELLELEKYLSSQKGILLREQA